MEDKKRNIILSLFSIGIVIMIAVGLTFAYFSTSMTGTAGITSVTTGTIGKITFDGGADFQTSSEIEPPWTESKTFTITVAPSVVSQTIYVWMDYSNTVPELTFNVSNTSDGAVGDVVLDTTGTTKTVKLVEKTFEASTTTQVIEYTITVTLPETGVNQNQNQGKSFNASMYANLGEEDKVYYYNESNPTGTTTKPTS